MTFKTLELGIDRIDVFLTARNRKCPIGYIVISESSDQKVQCLMPQEGDQ